MQPLSAGSETGTDVYVCVCVYAHALVCVHVSVWGCGRNLLFPVRKQWKCKEMLFITGTASFLCAIRRRSKRDIDLKPLMTQGPLSLQFLSTHFSEKV